MFEEYYSKFIAYWNKNERDVEYLYIMRQILDKINAVKKLHIFLYGLTTIRLVQLKHILLKT